MNHEDTAVQLHSTLEQRNGSIGGKQSVDMTGAKLPIMEKEGAVVSTDMEYQHTPDEAEPTEHEKKTLRRIGDKFPASAYLIAAVELCERFTCKWPSWHYIASTNNGRRLWMPGSLPELHQ